jgi:7,8-dihydropterin-6-yl-methyl-4-(beta-D-ribofuranosyl)aminobenzene 5'-phosphate synthase
MEIKRERIKMDIRVVAEASTKLQRLFVGWGVSFLVGDDLLFDTFSNGEVIKNNFSKLSINVKQIRHVVISHEHWDHYGGLWYILENNPNVKVYICHSFSEEFKTKIKQYKVSIVEVSDFAEIKSNVFTTGEIIGEYNGKPLPEQSLIIKNKEISIITGCSHPGIIEIIKKVKKHFSEPIYLVLGGLHLYDKPISEVKKIVNEFKSLGVEKVAPCHCTGKQAVMMFKQEFKENFIKVSISKKIL